MRGDWRKRRRIRDAMKHYQATTGTDARLVVRMIGDEPRFALVAQ